MINDETDSKSCLPDTHLDQLNKLDLKLRGRETHVPIFQANLRPSISKLQNWCRKVDLGNIAMFVKLCEVLDESKSCLDHCLNEEVIRHLESSEKEFQRHFPELTAEEEALVRNSFSTSVDVSSICGMTLQHVTSSRRDQ
ncbi:uncharacterized protein [Panulirus ornatus]|uniref:uncharacterized protein n=1 Tax=Panulirus ornatus TaxID=150431 RepID=UPI003A8683DF